VAIYPTALTATQVAAHYATAGLVAHFTWGMANRFDLWPNAVPRYPSDINPGQFTVGFNACKSTGNPVTYTWTYPGGSFSSPRCDGFSTDLPPGQQTVTLTVTDAAGYTASVTQTIMVKDYLIVSIGDSLGSGEGNPDIPGVCEGPSLADLANKVTTLPCNTPPVWQSQYPTDQYNNNANAMCHRSTKAASAQAAQDLDSNYPHTSVTFLHLACSGASVTQGLLGGFKGQPPQLQEAYRARQGRPIDALLISIGGNDIHFRDILEKCIEWGAINLLYNPFQSTCDDANVQNQLSRQIQNDLRTLDQNLAILGNCVTAPPYGSGVCQKGNDMYLGVPANHVFITGYFDPARSDDGSFCNGGLLESPLHTEAWTWAENSIVAELNRHLGTAARHFHWHAIGDYNAPPYNNSFLTHGYCAKQTWIRPIRYDGDNTPAGDAQYGSFDIQGDINGTMHPNEEGHKRIAQSLIQALTATLSFT
jgi:lysophospholipase L1-like esterase